MHRPAADEAERKRRPGATISTRLAIWPRCDQQPLVARAWARGRRPPALSCDAKTAPCILVASVHGGPAITERRNRGWERSTVARQHHPQARMFPPPVSHAATSAGGNSLCARHRVGQAVAEDKKREMSGPVVQRDGSPETGVRRSLPVHGPPKAPIVPLGAGGHWLCRFFMQGGPSACRNGDKCPYSHDPNKPVSAHVYARVRGPRDDFAQSRSRTGSGFCAIASPCHLRSAPP